MMTYESRDTLICGLVLTRPVAGLGGCMVWFISQSWRNATSTWPLPSILCAAPHQKIITFTAFVGSAWRRI